MAGATRHNVKRFWKLRPAAEQSGGKKPPALPAGLSLAGVRELDQAANQQLLGTVNNARSAGVATIASRVRLIADLRKDTPS